jgi:hypothetical protein
VFQPARGAVRKNSSNILAFRDDGSVLVDSRSLAPRDVTDELGSIIVLGEAKPARAVPWTQPVDISGGNFARLDALLAPHGQFYIVATASGEAKAIPRETADESWAAAIGRADGQLPAAQLMPPNVVPLDDAEGDISVRELEGDLAPTEDDEAGDADGAALPIRNGVPQVSISEAANVGAVVARATRAPPGYRYKLIDNTDAFAINPRTGVITVERNERIDFELHPSHLLKVAAVNARGDQVPVTIVGGDADE